MKTGINELGHINKLAVMLMYGKHLQNLLLHNQLADELETW